MQAPRPAPRPSATYAQLLLLAGLLLAAFGSAAQRHGNVAVQHLATYGRRPDNTEPMYGPAPKSKRHQRIDARFVRESVALYGSRDSAAHEMVRAGWHYLKRRDPGTAMKRFNQAWLLDSLLPDPYFGFATVLDLQHRSAEAARCHALGEARHPDHRFAPRYYVPVAECKAFYHDHDGAIAAYQRYTQWLPTRADGYQQLGYHLMTVNRDSAALATLTKAIALDPTSAVTINNRGWLHFQNKRYLLALSDFSAAIDVQPDYISAYVNRGLARQASGSREGARDDFAAAVRLNPKSAELRLYLAEAHQQLSDTAAACSEYRAAQQLNPPTDLAAELAARVRATCP